MMPSVFIAGCGFVGLATARHFHQHGWTVIAGTHSAESAARLSGEPFRVIAADITDRSTLGALSELRRLDTIVHCASSGRGGPEEYRQVYLEGVRALHFLLEPRQLIFTSSTSVYAQNDGSWVDEDSPAEPQRETGKILAEAEKFVLARGGAVARLAGIYGPGRSVLLQKFMAGQAVIEDGGTRFINQIHRDDAASALFRLAATRAQGVFNVTDSTPTSQRETYSWLAKHFGRPLPPEGTADVNRKRGVTNKRVSNARLLSLGWTPRYPSFRTAVESEPEMVAGLG
jgi:nucleoside-diphosphate-sugar epimerase